MHIREYKQEDYSGLREVLERCNLFSPELDTSEGLAKKLELSPGSILVAEEHNKVVGSVYLIADGWNAFLFRLAVHPDYQGRKISLALEKEAESRLAMRGIKRVTILVRESELERLDPIYQRRGFVRANGKHQVYHKNL